jgi:hypothetical protein
LQSLTLWIGNRDEEPIFRPLVSRLQNLQEVQLIQYPGGMLFGTTEEHNAQARALADLVNQQRGASVARIHRPFEMRFPLRREVSHGITAGRLAEGFLGVAAVQYHGDYVSLAILDNEGRFLHEEVRELKGLLKRKPEKEWESYNKAEVLDYLDEEFGFKMDLIHVQEFVTGRGVSVFLYANHIWELIESPDVLPEFAVVENRDEVGSTILDWLRSGNFVVEFGNDGWADRRGHIHST